MVAIEFIAFVMSSGLFFSGRFRTNMFAVGVAGLIAVVSSYLLLVQLTDDLVKKHLSESPPRVGTQERRITQEPASSEARQPARQKCVTFNSRLICE